MAVYNKKALQAMCKAVSFDPLDHCSVEHLKLFEFVLFNEIETEKRWPTSMSCQRLLARYKRYNVLESVCNGLSIANKFYSNGRQHAGEKYTCNALRFLLTCVQTDESVLSELMNQTVVVRNIIMPSMRPARNASYIARLLIEFIGFYSRNAFDHC